MDKSVNPDQYIVRLSKLNRQIIETQMAARKECIRILKENPSGQFIDIWERESNDWHYDDNLTVSLPEAVLAGTFSSVPSALTVRDT